jgi:protein-S-isoprenylcysteine O-methyltransferase Ste14
MTLVLDLLERAAILALYGRLVYRIVSGCSEGGQFGNLMLLPSEGLVVLFVLVRRTTSDVSRQWGHWILAFAATAAPMLVQASGGRPLVPVAWGATIILMGMIIQVHAKLVLGRSMGCVAANRGLKFSGPYRHVRHPMYAGYLLTHFAFLLMNPTLYNMGLYLTCCMLQVSRIGVEERLLAKDSSYRNYIEQVRFRLIPPLF